jgi:hypothetical protein
MLLGKSNMKIIHWEYNEDLAENENEGTPKLVAGAVRNRDTNKPTGVYFRWTYLLANNSDVYLHCVGEDSYKIANISEFTLEDIKLILCQSFDNFRNVFCKRLDIIGLEVPAPVFKIDDELLAPLLNEIKS